MDQSSNEEAVSEKPNQLTQARLKELLRYEPETGHFFWRTARQKITIGNRAGSICGTGYWHICIDGKTYLGHRLAFLYMHGYFPKGPLEHKNRDRSSCRIADLREASDREAVSKKPGPLTQARLRELLSYDPETGHFFWIVATSRVIRIGNRAGCINSVSGYWVIRIDGKGYLAHRLAFLYTHGRFPDGPLVHKDRDRANNRIENLRKATPHQLANSRIPAVPLRYYSTGAPAKEHWRRVAGYENLYAVSTLGRVFSLRTDTLMTPRVGNKRKEKQKKDPYLWIALRNGGASKKFSIHKLVLTAFRGPRPEGKECRHLDGDPINNVLSNLVWGTREENRDDQHKHRKKIKLTPELVRYIRSSTKTQRALAAEVGCSKSNVGFIKRRIWWAHV